jgi:formate/nitrite transporter FocA (FNT family)
MAYAASFIFAGAPAAAFAKAVAVKKTSATFFATFLKGVGANWLV